MSVTKGIETIAIQPNVQQLDAEVSACAAPMHFKNHECNKIGNTLNFCVASVSSQTRTNCSMAHFCTQGGVLKNYLNFSVQLPETT